jgi:flavin reductase (DIM6/NTAB) family NADH-FMN oxidoreductase RutF
VEGQDAFKWFLGPTVPTLITTLFPHDESRDGPIASTVLGEDSFLEQLRRRVNVGPCSWIQKVSYEPQLIVLAQKPDNDTLRNLREGGWFGVNVPPNTHAQDALLCGQRPPFGKSELELPGVRFEVEVDRSMRVALLRPRVQHAVCEMIEEKQVGDHVLVIARVHEVWIDGDFRLDTLLYWNKREFQEIGGMPFMVHGY